MTSSPVPHMSSDELRRHGHAVVDWIADYLDRVVELPVQSRVEPGWVRSRLPAHPPQTGEPFAAVLRDLDEIVVPGLTHWQSPNFFGYFPAETSGPAILGDLLSAGLGVQGMSWATSPACTELETHVLDWMVELLGLPERFLSSGPGGGVIQDSASSAALCTLAAARERAVARHGVDPTLVVAYTSTETHSSVAKGARVAGVGHVRAVEVDGLHAMRPDALEESMTADRRAGLVPAFVCATIGTTSSTAIDPVRAIAQVAARHDVWVHVDAAYAGTAALCPELRHHFDGLELVDSYVFNPHKWMLTNFDCSCLWVADRAALVGALGILPEYLKNAATTSGEVIDYRDWQIPLGRRFRALKLWMVLRHYGAAGLRAHVREHIELCRWFEARIDADPRFELCAPAPFSLVCFRCVVGGGGTPTDGDGVTADLLAALNGSGRIFLTHTRLAGKLVLRMAIGATMTERHHVEAAWELISELADAALADAGLAGSE